MKFYPLFLISTLLAVEQVTSLSPNYAQNLAPLDTCGGTVEADSGTVSYTFTTPGETCIWTVHLKEKTRFRYYFTTFDVPGRDTNCTGASLGIYSLNNIFSESFQGLDFCNEKNYSPSYFYEDGHTLAIILRTDAYATSGRVGISWLGQQTPTNPPSHGSSFTTTSTGLVRYPVEEEYPPNSVNTWVVQPSILSTEATLTLENIDIEGCQFADRCLCDALVVYGVTPRGNLQVEAKFCGDTTSGEVTLTQSNKFIAVFFTDFLDDPGRGFGFQLVWRSGAEATTPITTTSIRTTTERTTTELTTTPEPDQIIATECGGTIDANYGKILYKPNETYSNSERCAWIIRSPTHHKALYLSKIRSGFELGADYLGIYGFDKLDSTAVIMGKTTNDPETRYIYQGSVAVVVFTSDAANTGTGFELDFRFNGTVDSGVRIFNDYFSSDVEGLVRVGGPNPGDSYGDYVLSTFVMSRNNTYYSDIGWTASIHIFRVEDNGLPACTYDGIRVYSVALDSLSFVGRYCSNSETTVGPFLARNLYIFVFATDSSVNAGGFEITWRLR